MWGAAGTHRADDNQVVSGSSEVVSKEPRPPTSVQLPGRPGENNHVGIFVHGATDTNGMPFVAFDGLSSCGVNNRVEVAGNPEAWETNPEILPREP